MIHRVSKDERKRRFLRGQTQGSGRPTAEMQLFGGNGRAYEFEVGMKPRLPHLGDTDCRYNRTTAFTKQFLVRRRIHPVAQLQNKLSRYPRQERNQKTVQNWCNPKKRALCGERGEIFMKLTPMPPHGAYPRLTLEGGSKLLDGCIPLAVCLVQKALLHHLKLQFLLLSALRWLENLPIQ